MSRTLGINSGACSGFLSISEIFQKISDDTQKTSESFLVCSRIVFSFSRTKVRSLRKKQFLTYQKKLFEFFRIPKFLLEIFRTRKSSEKIFCTENLKNFLVTGHNMVICLLGNNIINIRKLMLFPIIRKQILFV